MKNWYIDQSILHPVRSIVLALILTLLMGTGIKYFKVEDDFLKLIPQNMQSVMTWNEIKDEFGSTDMIFVAFGHPGEDVLNSQALASLWDVARAMEEVDQVDEVMSIATSDRMNSEDGFLEVDAMQPFREMGPEDIDDLKTYLDETPKMKTRVLGSEGDFLNVIIRPVVNYDKIALIHHLVAAADANLVGYDVHWGGQAYLTGTLPALIQKDVASLMRFGLLGMLVILMFSFRNFSAVGMVLATILLSLVSMMGFHGWMYHLTGSDIFLFSILNTSMPIILLTIANSYGVHVITKFFRKMRTNKDKRAAVSASLKSLMLPIFLAAFTTIAAFLCMVFAPLEALAGYGLSISLGIVWAWLLSTLFLPSILVLKNWKATSSAVSHASHFENFVMAFGDQVIKRPKQVLFVGLLVVIVGGLGVFKLNIEVNMKNFFKPSNPIRQSMDFMDAEMTGTMDLQLLINSDLKSPEILNRMESLQEFLERHPSVTVSFSIADIIKQMHRMVNDNDPAFETIPDSRDKVNNLFTLYSMSGDPDDFSSLVDYDYQKGLVSSLMRAISTQEIVKLVNELEAFLNTPEYAGMDITITGMLVVFRDLVALIIRSSFISIFASILLVAIIAAYFFKHWLWGLIAIIPLSAAVLLNFGLMGLFGIDLNHVTALLSAIIIGVGVDFAIHYISQFRIHLQRGDLNMDISRETMQDVGFPVILDAASNMAFGALLFSEFVPMIHMGGLMIFAMISTSVGTLTLLAVILELSKQKLARIESVTIPA